MDLWLETVDLVQKQASSMPLWLHVQNSLRWWKLAGASGEVISLLELGVLPDVPLPSMLSRKDPPRRLEEVAATQKILREYAKSDEVKMTPQEEARQFVPYFILTKNKEGKKQMKGS